MIEVNDAIAAAHNFITDIYEKTEQTQLLDLQLEEVQRSEDDKFWLITFGFVRKKNPINELQKVIGTTNERVYKLIKVNAESGQPLAMQMKN